MRFDLKLYVCFMFGMFFSAQFWMYDILETVLGKNENGVVLALGMLGLASFYTGLRGLYVGAELPLVVGIWVCCIYLGLATLLEQVAWLPDDYVYSHILPFSIIVVLNGVISIKLLRLRMKSPEPFSTRM